MGAECIIAREAHADGGTHFHVLLDFGRKRRGRRHDTFDVDGHHANITPSRGKPGEAWDYVTKFGDVVAGGLERPGGGGDSPSPSKWAEIVAAESREQFLGLVERLDPRALVLNHSNIMRFADWRFRVDPAPYETPPELWFDTANFPSLGAWVDENIGGHQIGR